MGKIRKIGVLTSGGDAPGMNAAIRGVVRTAVYNGLEVMGIRQGYQGMIDASFMPMNSSSVSDIIQKGGTILKTARCEEFKTTEGRLKAYNNLKEAQIDGVVVIGGDGSFTGARLFNEEFDIPFVGIPGTIDNDIYGTDYTIGYDTALNTVVEAVDKIRDTASAHNRMFFVEVMGAEAGFIALYSGIATGAEAIIIPEIKGAEQDVKTLIEAGNTRKKSSNIIIVAEGHQEGGAFAMAEQVKNEFKEFDVRVSVLGHLQRGGSPSAIDRVNASRLGHAAVEALIDDQKSVMVGIMNGEITLVPFRRAVKLHKDVNHSLVDLQKYYLYRKTCYMSSSKVYFTNLRSKPSQNLYKKLDALIIKAGIDQIDFKKKIVAVKLHFGEPGNLAYLRPNYAARIVKYLKAKEAIPFLTDCNTLYYGSRSNAPMHIEAAFENGYNPLTTNCPVIIGDGIKGTDYREIELNLEYCESAKIGSAIADADIIISMNHFKGHEMTGFGGALKNLGMGCASVGGKLFLHSGSSPEIFEKNCTGCRVCEKYCAHDAIGVGPDKIAHIDYIKCVGCGQCVAVCQYDSARVVWQNSSETVCKRIAEYSLAVVRNKPAFHINFIMNVSPDCDCWGFNDYPLVPDLGFAASYDPVALDQACADLVKAAPALAGSRLYDHEIEGDLIGEDKFKLAHPDTFWQAGIEHAVKIGLGSADYELVTI